MSADTPATPVDMGAGRMEAFSDAVIAVLITILVLGLGPPAGTTKPDVLDWLRGLPIYVLSFVFIAIYWNNHHHLLRSTTRISAGAMWANMALLFCLSLIPLAAEWLYGNASEAVPAAFFGIVGLAAGLSYFILVRALIRANGRGSAFARAIGSDVKGIASLVLYAVGVALAPVSVYLTYTCYVVVSVMWLIPDRRFTHAHVEAD